MTRRTTWRQRMTPHHILLAAITLILGVAELLTRLPGGASRSCLDFSIPAVPPVGRRSALWAPALFPSTVLPKLGPPERRVGIRLIRNIQVRCTDPLTPLATVDAGDR